MRKNVVAIGILLYGLCLTGCQSNNDVTAPKLTNTPVPTEVEMPVPTDIIVPEPTATSTPMPSVAETPVPTLTDMPIPEITMEAEITDTSGMSITEVPEPTLTSTLEPTVTSTPTPKPTNTPIPTRTVEYTVFEYDYGTFYVTRDVKVYDTPHGMGNLLGVVEKGTQVSISGKCSKTGWYQINYNGKNSFISGGYLSKDKSNIKEVILGTNEVIIPDISGLSYEEATELLIKNGLKVSDMIFAVESVAYDMDQVCTSDPAPGEVVKKGSMIYLIESFGDFSIYNTTVYESLANTKIVKRTLVERTTGGVSKDFEEYDQYSAHYNQIEELEYDDGTILRVSYKMQDSCVDDVNWVIKINEPSNSQKPTSILSDECRKILNIGKQIATYSLGSFTKYSGWGTGNSPSSGMEHEYLVEYTKDGYHFIMNYSPDTGSKLIFTDYVENLNGYKTWEPLFWAKEYIKNAEPNNSYINNKDTFYSYDDETTVVYSGNEEFVDVIYSDQSGYKIFYSSISDYYAGEKNEYKVIDHVTFYEKGREELYSIYLYCGMKKDFCFWYKYVGEGKIQLVNSDGTPIEKYKEFIFHDSIMNPITGEMEKVCYNSSYTQIIETKKHEYHIDTYKFVMSSTQGGNIAFYQNDFPIEDY